MTNFVEIRHNLDGNMFVWLWMKYVTDINDTKHCTNSLYGPYSKKMSRHNPNLISDGFVICDEKPVGSYSALYICGVSQKGYRKKENYSHNLHVPILPALGEVSNFSFENWRITVRNGLVLSIPTQDQIPDQYRNLPAEFTTCRIFRWAVGWKNRGFPSTPKQLKNDRYNS
jgi:hypothetical protein